MSPKSLSEKLGIVNEVGEKPIEPLKIEAISGFRAQFKRLLRRWGPPIGVGLALGGAAGQSSQNWYRELTGYSGEPTAESTEEPGEAASTQEAPKGLWTKAKGFLGKAKEVTKDKIAETSYGQKYQEMKSEFQKLKEGILEAGDTAAFSGPFLLIFLATALMTSKLMEFRAAMRGDIDPVLEANLSAMVSKINELVEAANARDENKGVSRVELEKIGKEVQQLSGQFEELALQIDQSTPRE